MSNGRVAVVMGSDSDWACMERCVTQLADLGLAAHVEVMSAHRGPARVEAFASAAAEGGFEVIIAAAGLSAALPGVIAARTTLPVIGVPMESGSLLGLDALLSTVQMPPGVPVASVGIGPTGATNAAILAAQIIATHDPDVARALQQFKSSQQVGVEAKNRALQERLRERTTG